MGSPVCVGGTLVPGPSRAFWTFLGRSGVPTVDNVLLCTRFPQTGVDIDK